MKFTYKDFIDELKEIKKIQDECAGNKHVDNKRYFPKTALLLIAPLAISIIAYLVWQ